MSTTTTARKPRIRKTATLAAPEKPVCVECQHELDWRDGFYGSQSRCKRCSRKALNAVMRGRFIPAREYVAILAERGRVQ